MRKMAPPKRSAVEASTFEDSNTISKQKLAAQAHLARGGRRGNGNGNGTHGTSLGQTNNAHSSLKDLANVSEAVRDQNGIAAANVRRVPFHPLYTSHSIMMSLFSDIGY